MSVLAELKNRGLIHDTTNESELSKDLDAGLKFYVGFDPTAPSLHIGNLVQILTARRLQLAGNKPFALVGGATGLIGDPKMSGERSLNEQDIVQAWSAKLKNQLQKFFDFEGENSVELVNNFDWTHNMTVIEFLREVGKHFSVNRMLDREAVAVRLAGPGISFTEFSYQILQAHDYLHLNQQYGVTLQTGGSDQWGNLTAGTDLVRRVTGNTVHALCTTLLTKSDGGKFGKTEDGTVWLDSTLTSPYAFYQFWLNLDDADLERMLKVFSFKTLPEIDAILEQSRKEPHLRIGQRALAQEMTALVHSVTDMQQAEQAAAILFGTGELDQLNEATLEAALLEAGLTKTELENGRIPSIVDLFVTAGVAKSKTEARRMINDGAAWVNNHKIVAEDLQLTQDSLLYQRFLVLRRGRKTIAGIELIG